MLSLLASLASLFGGGALGTLFGILGGAVTRYFDLKNASLQITKGAQDNSHELAMKQMDLDIMKAEATSNFAVAKLNAASLESAQDVELLKAGYNFEPQTYADKSKLTAGQNWVFAVLDLIRGLIRPGLTAYFAVFMTLIFWQAIRIMTKEGMAVNPEEAYTLVMKCVDLVITLFATCTTFYFSTRNKASEAKARAK